MTDQTGGDQPQKTVAELLAQHGAQVDGGSRRRRRRAAEDEDELAPPDGGTGTHRRPGVSDTGSQAIIDRVNAEQAPPPPPPARPAAAPRRRPEPQPSQQLPVPPPAPRPVPQESQQLPRPGAPRPATEASGYQPRPATEASGYQRMPQESGQYPARPPQESGQYPRPPQESQQLPVPPRAPRRQPPPAPQPSQQLPVPQPSQQLPVPPSAEPTRAVPPVTPARRRPAGPPPAPPAPAPPPSGALSARLDGLNGTPDAEVDVPPGPMASGQFATPPPAATPRRPRRAPARRPQPKDAYTEQFSAVPDEVETPQPPAPPKKPSPTPDISSPAGLANWRKRREKEQLEDTEIGVMPAVPVDDEFGEDDGFSPESSGYQAAYDAGPATGAYPPPMPFAPGDSNPRMPVPDDLAEYEREFAEPAGYPAEGPDFDQDDYGYDQGEYDEDEYDEDVAEPAPEPAVAASPGKAWLALAGQLALGVVGGAAVWLGFNWLWVKLPAAALVAALLVVVALVWIVRKIRRADDLQTTVLAVLVGLVVTVSPAALLLVGSR